MRIDLSQRVALVTGGAQGIGRSIALELARAGAGVIVADLDQSKSDLVVAEVRALGVEASALHVDVRDDDSVESCVADAISRFVRVNVLVNNAGTFQKQLGFEQGAHDFNRCLDVNLTGIWRMTRALAPHFRAKGGGAVVNVASVGGRRGLDFAPAYCASKAGVISLTQSLAAALGGHNVNVNAVCPGSIATAMQDNIVTMLGGTTDVIRDARQPPLPLAGPLTAADVGYAVVFLASDYAKNITGQALNVDCGSFMN